MIIDLDKITVVERQYYLQHVVAPRPICFASTIDLKGNVNLSPFSFFNLFSANPPIVIFSPSRRIRDNTTKHTLENLHEVPEVVINMVSYDMVHQVSLASCEFPKGTNEFEKAGFTEEAATLVKPPMVKESKVKLECRVNEIKPLGKAAGAGNLVICEVMRMHLADTLFNEAGKLEQARLQQVARLGGDWYSVVNEQSLFQVEKPNTQLGIGFDGLPSSIRFSKVLSGNDLGQLANTQTLPDIDPSFDDDHLKQVLQYYSLNPADMENELHLYAQKLLREGKVAAAWQILLASGN